MPALKNPRHEAFAQAIVAGLANGDKEPFSRGRAYHKAGYIAQGKAADVNAHRLLTKANHIFERVRELQAEANKRLEPKLDISRERIGRRLDKASRIAEQQENAANMVAAELGLAKVFRRLDEPRTTEVDFNSAKSMHDIGRKLLQSVGFKEPDDASIREAIELNDTFIDGLQAIHQRAQALTLGQA